MCSTSPKEKYKSQFGIYVLTLIFSVLFHITTTHAGTTQNIGTNLPLMINTDWYQEFTATVNFRFLPSNTAMRQTEQSLERHPVLETIKQLSQKRFVFSPALNIVFRSDDGPLFDPVTNSIHIPYQFFSETSELFKKKGLFDTRREVNQATEDALLHTLLHEIGHAYIADRAIPFRKKRRFS
ncbi:DUF4344 domain-containing metallopeptidase [Photobacterium leiognathi subsp. mandapamensis]